MALNFADLFEHAVMWRHEDIWRTLGGGIDFITGEPLASPAVKDSCAAALPGVFITEAIGSSETGFAGLSFVTADPAALQEHARRQIAGHKSPRTIWLVDSIGRTAAGQADYAWAREHAVGHPPDLDRPPAGHPASAKR